MKQVLPVIGIDASNITGGGGLVHLKAFINTILTVRDDIPKIVVWANASVLNQLPNSPVLVKHYQSFLEKNFIFKVFWRKYILPKIAKNSCDMLFYPGGYAAYKKMPYVVMHRNFLPFMWRELFRYKLSLTTFRLILLRYLQIWSFKKADGVIFLTNYGKQYIEGQKPYKNAIVIPHGRSLSSEGNTPRRVFMKDNVCKLLYVSIIDVYKHQVEVVQAAHILRQSGVRLELKLIGPAYKPALKCLHKVIQQLDPHSEYIQYQPFLPHDQLLQSYQDADIFVFASSCETFGQILLEAMSAGCVITSSNRAVMPEILGDAGLYFNPEDPEDIAFTISKLIASQKLRATLSSRAIARSVQYSWSHTAESTLRFILDTYSTKMHHLNTNNTAEYLL